MMAKQIISSLTGLFLFVACIDQTALSAKLERPIGQSSNAQPKPRPTATPVKTAPNSDAKLTTGQKLNNHPPANNIEVLQVRH